MTSMITARVDLEKRKTAEKVFSEVGLTTSAAVNLFICAVAMSGGIPFKIGVNNAVGYPWDASKVESSLAWPRESSSSRPTLTKSLMQWTLRLPSCSNSG